MPYRLIKRKVNKLFITLYVLMMVGMLGSLGFAIQQNWELKLQSTQSDLSRQAGIGSFVLSNGIAHATQSLAAAQRALQPVLNGGPLSALQAHEVLQSTLSDFLAYSNTNYEGLLLYIDPQGQLVARTDHYPAERIDLSDRLYVQRLQQSPQTDRVIGPLVRARSTGEWVFHVSTPLRDKYGHFRGVLAQQIRATDIAKDLVKYVDTQKKGLLISQSSEAGLSFVYPLHWLVQPGLEAIETPYADYARRSTSPQDAFIWPRTNGTSEARLLVGYEHSEVSGLLTTIRLPLSEVAYAFFLENLFLLAVVCLAVALITGIFVHLYRTYHHLTDALHDAYSDSLTQLPNRRAFEDMLPRLLREAMRNREPLSVLFVDIDHFKLFNDDYGHDGGDIALRAVACALSQCATRPLDFACRWGGEEFVVLLPHTPLPAATLIAERMLETVRALQLLDKDGQTMRQVSVSIGIASGDIRSLCLGQELVHLADVAMQQAKQEGRDRCVVHDTAPPSDQA